MENRIRLRLENPIKEDASYVLYWMQHTQRILDNRALYWAAREANRLQMPLKVVFCIATTFEEGADRHYHFMLEGLQDLRKSFEKRGIDFTVVSGEFLDAVPPFFKDAAMLFMDKAYTRPLRSLRRAMLEKADGLRVQEVESDVTVPVERVTDKLEYAARTIRKKLWRQLETPPAMLEIPNLARRSESHASLLDKDHDVLIAACDINHAVGKTDRFHGGEREALRRFNAFLQDTIHMYADKSNDPGIYAISTLSPYLHFGMISPLYMLKSIQQGVKDGSIEQENADAYLEQLVVRRELAFNYVYFHEYGYDGFDTMTYAWAYKTMEVHKDDPRVALYDIDTLKAAETHDPYWNACMREMVDTGFMHNYMRMYWGKTIIQWSKTYEVAYETIRTLNNLYFLDGRDPNSYAGIAWCFGRHDRAFAERDVLGKLRPLSANGLKRKFDIDAYVKRFSNE